MGRRDKLAPMTEASSVVAERPRASPGTLRFGRFEIRPAQRQLLAAGEVIALGPRAFDVLLALAERPGELVTKDDLLEIVWPGLVVEENNLQVQVSAIRKLLGAEAIATIPGRGYRFTLAVDPAERAQPAARATPKLPRPLTRFIGREEVLAEYVEAVHRTRLLTLTGIGGCGKTRLAIELAALVGTDFDDGVAFVDLAPIADPDRLGTALAAVLEVREPPAGNVENAITQHLAPRALLLVLDNCEHLLDACAALVVRLLEAAPRLHVIVTSREPLGMPGEQTLRVPSLSLAVASGDLDALARSEAVRLFCDRARQVLPQFALNADNAAAVVEICRRLDGLPLAIELAAARVKMLSPEEIRAKLDDRFRLLTGGARALARHQTLLAALRWSYEHLAPDEQSLLEALGVFSGGATLASITAVAGEGEDELAMLDRLERLVDRSLVLVDPEARPVARYRMLETVRQYAEERLCDAGREALLRERHLAHFLALAQRAEAGYYTAEVVQWVERVDADLSNLLAAHAYCDHVPDGATRGLELASALRFYWLQHGLFALGQQVFDQALARPGAAARTMTRARTLFAASQHLYFQWRLAEVVPPTEEALAIAREQGDDEWIALCLMRLGAVHAWLGELERGHEEAKESLAVAERTGVQSVVALAYAGQGEVAQASGDFDAAARAYERAVALHPRTQFPNLAGAYVSLARIAMGRGALDEARQQMIQAILALQEIRPTHHGHYHVYAASRLAAMQGDWQRAAWLRGAADAAVEDRGGIHEQYDERVDADLRARLETMSTDPSTAAAYARGRAVTLDHAVEEVLTWLRSPAHRNP